MPKEEFKQLLDDDEGYEETYLAGDDEFPEENLEEGPGEDLEDDEDVFEDEEI